jgi:hypothetical protein
MTHKIAIQLHLIAESCNICSSHFRRPVRKLLVYPCVSVASIHGMHGSKDTEDGYGDDGKDNDDKTEGRL